MIVKADSQKIFPEMRGGIGCAACGNTLCLRCRIVKQLLIQARELEIAYPRRLEKYVDQMRRTAEGLQSV